MNQPRSRLQSNTSTAEDRNNYNSYSLPRQGPQTLPKPNNKPVKTPTKVGPEYSEDMSTRYLRKFSMGRFIRIE